MREMIEPGSGDLAPAGATSDRQVPFAPAFPEWAEPASGAPIRQGDVLSAVNPTDDVWRKVLVVITADCDLANSKHDGALTCVPVLTLTNYLLMFRFEKLRDSLVERTTRTVLSEIANAESSKATPRISVSRMREWVAELGASQVLDSLSDMLIPDRVPSLIRLVESMEQAQPIDIPSAVNVLAEAKTRLGDFKDIEKARSSIANEFAASLRTLPGDVLLLNEVSAAHSEGYIAYLRRAFEVVESSAVTSYSRVPHHATYVRISRLRPPYVYALTQQFGAVFSAIGLPTPYETARSSIADRIKSGEY